MRAGVWDERVRTQNLRDTKGDAANLNTWIAGVTLVGGLMRVGRLRGTVAVF